MNNKNLTDSQMANYFHMQDRSISVGGNVGGNVISGDVKNSFNSTNVLKAVEVEIAKIQQLIQQLEQTYPTNTTKEQMMVATEAINRIESDPTWKQRVVLAARGGGLAAFEKAIDNPVGAFIIGAIKGWLKAERKY